MIKTAAVLAGAYPKSHKGSYLTHLVEVTTGWPVPQCKTVKVGSVTDDTTTHTDDRPTCKVCARKWDKLHP